MSKEFTFVYQHTNGAMIYEASDGEKYIKYDDLAFESMAQVNAYIKESNVRLWRDDIKDPEKPANPDQFVTLSLEDYKALKGE